MNLYHVRPAITAGKLARRHFLRISAAGAAALVFLPEDGLARAGGRLRQPRNRPPSETSIASLPVGPAPAPVPLPHFPSRLHAFVWRNWQLVPAPRLAKVVGATTGDILRLGKALGLPDPPRISTDQWRRSALTIIRRNWHILPYDQLLALLGWTAEELAFTLREDDFLFVKLGSLKPKCEPLRYSRPDEMTRRREQEIASLIRAEFPAGPANLAEPLFGFIPQLARKPKTTVRAAFRSALEPRFCHSYFALYGDPLLNDATDPYPEGYLARLAACGVDGVWLQGLLSKLAPFPWQPNLSQRHEERAANLRSLVARARRHGIGVYLYLNEPRAMPIRFFAEHRSLQGVTEGDHGALCTSNPDVQNYIVNSVAHLCRAVPGLAGFFTITASENLTNCWSHANGSSCLRCRQRTPAEVIGELNNLFHQGITQAGSRTRLIVWDWGWADGWAQAIIDVLPPGVDLMSVSEWDLPIRRGGIESVVGEYSISAVGPGPRAKRHWAWARKRGMRTLAKVQAGNTWELSAVPYIPAVENVARHAANLREAKVDGLMLGWTLGGYPSPNLEVVAELAPSDTLPDRAQTPEQAMDRVARRRFGSALAPAMVNAWRQFSQAFSEFPFHSGLVYNAPLQFGPSNLLWEKPTGYRATMIGFPYDDLDAWRQVYPADVFINQFKKVAEGFDRAIANLKRLARTPPLVLRPVEESALRLELSAAEAAAVHFHTTANQARFVVARQALGSANSSQEAERWLGELERIIRAELDLARRLHAIQIRDSRIGFEASNQYYYVPLDLVEKVLNCHDLLTRWLPAERSRNNQPSTSPLK
jgi:hypothetical protein